MAREKKNGRRWEVVIGGIGLAAILDILFPDRGGGTSTGKWIALGILIVIAMIVGYLRGSFPPSWRK